MRALIVDCVTCSRSAALTKLPAATTVRKVRASSVSMAHSQIDIDYSDINGRFSSFFKFLIARYADSS
jgi:hypothetical protein